LILQNQALLDANHPSTLVIPLTTNLVEDSEPLRIRIIATNKLDAKMHDIYSAVIEVMGMEEIVSMKALRANQPW
jgi:hypothetical protein